MEMRENGFIGLDSHGFHRVAYTEWGDARSTQVLVCVHGLTGNGRQFDTLAAAMAAAAFRVVCPDLPGRGHSDWLSDPGDYDWPQYLNDMTALLARLDVGSVDWVGTSLGGLVGMRMAAAPDSPIRRLVLNDIGPQVPKAILDAAAGFTATMPVFADLDEAERFQRRRWETNGPYTDADWRHFTEHGVRRDGEGGWRLHHDPAIAVPYRRTFDGDLDWWAVWNRIECPVLVLRGTESDTLLEDTVERMLDEGPDTRLVGIPGIGHCPGLRDAPQIDVVCRFLSDGVG